MIDGGPGNDHLIGGGGRDTLDGGQGTDGCSGAKGRTDLLRQGSAAEGIAPTSSSTRRAGGGGGLQIVGGAGPDDFVVAFDEASRDLRRHARRRRSRPGPAARTRAGVERTQVTCPADGPARWLMADLGPGNDSLAVKGSLVDGRQRPRQRRRRQRHDPRRPRGRPAPVRPRRRPPLRRRRRRRPGRRPARPDLPLRRRRGDLLAAGGGCAGGALVGGPGRDDASFAETQAPPRPADRLLPAARRLDRRDPAAATTSTSRRPTRTWRAPSTTTS